MKTIHELFELRELQVNNLSPVTVLSPKYGGKKDLMWLRLKSNLASEDVVRTNRH